METSNVSHLPLGTPIRGWTLLQGGFCRAEDMLQIDHMSKTSSKVQVSGDVRAPELKQVFFLNLICIDSTFLHLIVLYNNFFFSYRNGWGPRARRCPPPRRSPRGAPCWKNWSHPAPRPWKGWQICWQIQITMLTGELVKSHDVSRKKNEIYQFLRCSYNLSFFGATKMIYTSISTKTITISPLRSPHVHPGRKVSMVRHHLTGHHLDMKKTSPKKSAKIHRCLDSNISQVWTQAFQPKAKTLRRGICSHFTASLGVSLHLTRPGSKQRWTDGVAWCPCKLLLKKKNEICLWTHSVVCLCKYLFNTYDA